MSRFLRNAIASARDPNISLQPRLPSLYAGPDGRGQEILTVEPLIADDVASTGETSTRDRLERFTPPTLSKNSAAAKSIGRRRHGQLDESELEPGEPHRRSATLDSPDPRSEPSLPRVMEDAEHLDGPPRHPPASSRDGRKRPSNAPARALPTSDAAGAMDAILAAPEGGRPRFAPSVREDSSGDNDPRGPLEPSPPEPWHAAEARSQLMATPSPQHLNDVATRSPRAGARAARSSAPSNDVEIHIGRIEVIAASPALRAPPKNAHPSPSLGDYLNGRRGRRP